MSWKFSTETKLFLSENIEFNIASFFFSLLFDFSILNSLVIMLFVRKATQPNYDHTCTLWSYVYDTF